MEAPIVLPSGHQIREEEEDKAMRETSVSSSSYFATKLEPLTFSITDVSFLACGVVVLIATSTGFTCPNSQEKKRRLPSLKSQPRVKPEYLIYIYTVYIYIPCSSSTTTLRHSLRAVPIDAG